MTVQLDLFADETAARMADFEALVQARIDEQLRQDALARGEGIPVPCLFTAPVRGVAARMDAYRAYAEEVDV